jgi:hypothetical protein
MASGAQQRGKSRRLADNANLYYVPKSRKPQSSLSHSRSETLAAL